MGKGNDQNAQCPECHKKLRDCSGHWQKRLGLLIACVIALCLVIFFIINNQDNSSVTVVSSKSDQKALDIRYVEGPIDQEKAKQVRSLQKEWLEAAQSVVKETNDQTAKEIYEFILKNGVLCYPHEQGFRIVEYPENGEYYFAFVPLFDYAKGIPELKRIFSIEAAGHFMHEEKALIIRESPPFSKIWRGLIVLHEAYHAKECLAGSLDWNDSRVFCEQEADTHIFQNRLMKKIGGKLYQQCLQEEFNRIKKESIIKNGVLQDFVDIGSYDSRLDEVFGPALSEHEINVRQTHVWIAAMFDFIDKTVPNAYKEKVNFLYSIYLDEGILQRR